MNQEDLQWKYLRSIFLFFIMNILLLQSISNRNTQQTTHQMHVFYKIVPSFV